MMAAVALTPEQEWTLVACGLMAHADEILEVGEWDQILRLVDVRLSDDDVRTWLDLLADRAALEARFSALAPPPAAFTETLLHECWRMALADGTGSEVEIAVHDRIADRLGADPDRVGAQREEWTRQAGERAELVVSFAAAMANLDGRLDGDEAVQFDALVGRLPLPMARRIELAGILYDPPGLESVGERMRGLAPEDREAVLHDIAPLVRASARGERERAIFMRLADLASVSADKARALLGG
jgi:hypothetical protein